LFDQVAGCTGCEFIEGALEGVSRNAPLDRTGITAPATGLSVAVAPGALAGDVDAFDTAALDQGQAAAAGDAAAGVPGSGVDSKGAAAGVLTVAGKPTAAVLTARAGFTIKFPGLAWDVVAYGEPRFGAAFGYAGAAGFADCEVSPRAFMTRSCSAARRSFSAIAMTSCSDAFGGTCGPTPGASNDGPPFVTTGADAGLTGIPVAAFAVTVGLLI
jgi:hypothetical protein